MRRGHRSAHAWVVVASAIAAAAALAFGWITRSRRPVPEPLAANAAPAPEAPGRQPPSGGLP